MNQEIEIKHLLTYN